MQSACCKSWTVKEAAALQLQPQSKTEEDRRFLYTSVSLLSASISSDETFALCQCMDFARKGDSVTL